MAIIREQLSHEYFPIKVVVSEKQEGEVVEPWRFCSFEVDSFEKFTPKELKQIGRWLIQQGTRIGRQYTSNGSPRRG